MTETVVRTVDAVRDKTTVPVIYAARAVVFGIVAAFLGVFVLVLVILGLLRGTQALLDIWVTQPRAVYLSYLIVGGAICLAGLLIFRKRNVPA